MVKSDATEFKMKTMFCMALFMITIFLLVTGSPLLMVAVWDSPYLPLGNLITWAGLISFPLSIFYGTPSLRKPSGNIVKWLSAWLKAMIILSLLWFPLSALLAGNLSNSFGQSSSFQGGQTAMRLFWIYSFGVPISTLIIWVCFGILKLVGRNKA